jgi:hypothetical protein
VATDFDQVIADPLRLKRKLRIGEDSSGSVYQYYNVPPSIWTELFAAPSKGRFLNAYIKNAYPFSRVG